LIGKLLSRRQRDAKADLERMTLAVNNGYSIARDPKALARWEQRRLESRPQSVAEYRATAARLAGRLPDNVLVN
jgi:hypothetical protein